MPRKSTLRLSRRVVEALAVERGDRVFYDRDLTGFGVRVHASGRKVYVVHARAPGGALKRVAIGRKVDITVEDARRVAAEVIDRLKKGEEAFPEPPAPEPTVADLAERYVEAHLEVNCRPGTIETFGRILRLYILPELGHMPLPAVERGHVAALHHKMRDKPYQANQTRDVLAKMFKLAAAWGMTQPRRNPALSIRRYKEYRRERFLSPEEYRQLTRVLDEAEADGSVFPTAIPAIRLLILTGCRKNEIVTLRWDDIDRTAGELLLRDGKTGARRVILTPAMEWAAGAHPAHRGQPLGHYRQESRRPSQEPRRHLAAAAKAGGSRRCADPRLQTFVCVPRAGDRRSNPADQRGPRAPEVLDDRAVCPPRARRREGVGGEGGRQHRRRHLRMG